MHSKEEKLLELFFNFPTREWHFEELVKKSAMARSKVAQWLQRFLKEGLIQRTKEKKKMPFYLGDYASPAYQQKKKLFAFQKLYESGFLQHLSSLKKIKTVVIFGSFSRADWMAKSDIDLFLYGNPEGLHLAKYELFLHRDIQPFICKSEEDLQKVEPAFLKSVLRGHWVKGAPHFVEVKSCA